MYFFFQTIGINVDKKNTNTLIHLSEQVKKGFEIDKSLIQYIDL